MHMSVSMSSLMIHQITIHYDDNYVYRKADLRELKMLHKLEKKQLQDMEIRNLAAIEEQNRKFEQDNAVR